MNTKLKNINAYDYLVEHNVKPSVQRLAVMEYLLSNSTHPKVEEIYKALSPKIPTLSKTTVYNTLRILVDNNAALMLTIDDKNACFDGDTSLHSHFLCKECGKVYDLPFSGNIRIVEDANYDGNMVEEVHEYYKGVCKKCLAKQDK